MSSLLDTTIIVDYLRNNSKAVEFLEHNVLSNHFITDIIIYVPY